MMLEPTMSDLLEKIPNRYLLVNVAAKRARDIADSAEQAEEPLDEKPVKIALYDIMDGRVRPAGTGGAWGNPNGGAAGRAFEFFIGFGRDNAGFGPGRRGRGITGKTKGCSDATIRGNGRSLDLPAAACAEAALFAQRESALEKE